jgi:predicted RNA-binding Zn-ribbon protein involved in translation (DUF1610 family)
MASLEVAYYGEEISKPMNKTIGEIAAENLLPCPFCGVVPTNREMVAYTNQADARGMCDNCGAQGPSAKFSEHWIAWNRRILTATASDEETSLAVIRELATTAMTSAQIVENSLKQIRELGACQSAIAVAQQDVEKRVKNND